jgi:hypothetical protein
VKGVPRACEFPRQAFQFISVEPKPAAGNAQIDLQRTYADDFSHPPTIGAVDRLALVPLMKIENPPIAMGTTSRSR